MPVAGVDRGELDRVVDEHFRAEEAEDIDGIVAAFIEDGELDGDGTLRLVGRQAIGEFYRALSPLMSANSIERQLEPAVDPGHLPPQARPAP